MMGDPVAEGLVRDCVDRWGRWGEELRAALSRAAGARRRFTDNQYVRLSIVVVSILSRAQMK